MPLSPGTHLGPYEVIGPLGAGGMGEVYRARDARLNRDVAIKILPPAFADDAARMARFQREAQVLAALNHPNIAAIYGLEELALVMELVEGETLAERIAAGAIPLDEALAIAHQIADALEAAHEKGIVHRDLKPANVKITPEGKVKVLDFGLAKAYDSAPASGPADSPTLTMEATRAGVILGTAGYMSPEQARGKPVDKRADIWSFGVVLYEMLTGRSTFAGETVSDTLASILKSDPDWSRLPAGTPYGVRRLLQRCLERDPKNRLRDIGDAWNDMDRPAEAVAAHPKRQWLPWALFALSALVAGAVTWGWLHTPPAPVPMVTRSSMTSVNIITSPALSPDGTRLAYTEAPASGLPHLTLRPMDQLEGRPIPGTENAYSPAFSPDGQWIVYNTTGTPAKLQKIPVTGGTPTTVCEIPGRISGATWGVDDMIVFGSSQGLMRVAAAGGTPKALTSTDPKKGETVHFFPSFLPGGKTVVFTVAVRSGSSRIVLLDLKTRAQRVVVNAGSDARYVPTGHLVYFRSLTLFAVPFDLKRLAVTGPETPVVQEMSGIGYTFSDASLLVFRRSRPPAPDESTLEWSDRKGAAQPLPEPAHAWGTFGVSPNGKLVAGSIRDAGGKASDIWIYDLDRRTLVRMTFAGSNTSPVWSPDGRWVTYGAVRDGKYGIYRVAADKSGPPELLLATELDAAPTSWTPDGKALFYTVYHPGGADIWTLRMSGGGESKPQQFSDSAGRKGDARVSPDGKWVAYTSYEPGPRTVYVVPLTGSGGPYQISTNGGLRPVWSRSGRELFYQDFSNQVMAVDVPAGPIFRPGTPQPLFKLTPGGAGYDVAPDPNRFLVEHVPETPVDYTFITITNWFDDLLRRAPLKH